MPYHWNCIGNIFVKHFNNLAPVSPGNLQWVQEYCGLGSLATTSTDNPEKMDGSGPECPDNIPVTWEWSHKNEALKIRAKERGRGDFIFNESKLECVEETGVEEREDDSLGREGEEGWCEVLLEEMSFQPPREDVEWLCYSAISLANRKKVPDRHGGIVHYWRALMYRSLCSFKGHFETFSFAWFVFASQHGQNSFLAMKGRKWLSFIPETKLKTDLITICYSTFPVTIWIQKHALVRCCFHTLRSVVFSDLENRSASHKTVIYHFREPS